MIYKADQQIISTYLKDASNYLGGSADKVIIPESVDELVAFLKKNNQPITISGAGTGMTASRIPEAGLIVSLENFKNLGDVANGFIDVGPAVSLADLNEHLISTNYFYPPNPTETLASIGGTLATNASGSRSYKYGATRDYVLEADIVFVDGKKASLKRGLTIKSPLRLSDGKEIHFPNIKYTSPMCKNAAGYYIQPNMDWLDLFIGSDGTLGIFTRIRLKLLSCPAAFISGILFFNTEEECWILVDLIKKSNIESINPCSLEYFDERSLNRLRKEFENIPNKAKAALFFENDIDKQTDYDYTQNVWFEFLNNKEVLLDHSWFAQSSKDLKRFHNFRHAIPVLINEENSRLRRLKIGTDMAVSDLHLLGMMKFYKDELEGSGVDFVVFGHLGDNHLHINLLPKKDQIEKAHEIYKILVNRIFEWKGTISAEHGIGKLKKKFFLQMVGESSLSELMGIKKLFDPRFLLGKGNIF